jgi:acyl-CoA synthetase (AMP-forming)/AMP-acid ligase II
MAPIYSYKLTRIDDSKKTKYDTSSLRCILTGGTPLSGEQLKRLKVLFPNADVIFGYGMTELARVSSFYPQTDKHLMESKPTSCGRIAPEISVKVQFLQLVKINLVSGSRTHTYSRIFYF